MIRLKNVSKHYDDVLAVDDVSIAVAPHELLVLLGSSGCGKTTTLRLIAGLERPSGGEIFLNGELVANGQTWVPPEQRRIGMVFQDYALFPHLTVAQNIEFPLNGIRGAARQRRVLEMLDLVGLTGTEKRFPHQLSGGQQQRVALARALAAEPTVVLLDEPFSNLDASLRKFMREEVRRILKAADTTAIFVTHDQEEAMRIADRVAVMRGGNLLQAGKPEDLYRYPATQDVANFLGETNWLAGVAKGQTVETALGILPLAKVISGHVEVMIRPEALTLLLDEQGDGCVVDTRFFGHYQLITVKLGDGTLLDVRVWAQLAVDIGASVSLRVDGAVMAFA